MLEISRWTRNVLTWVVWASCTVGLVAGDTQCWPGACPTDGIYIGFGFRSGFGVLWFGVCSADRGRFCTRSDRYTVVACARFRCDRWGTCWAGARQILVGFQVWSGYRWWDRRQSCEICTCTLIHMTKISFSFLFCSESLLFACCIMSCHVGNKLYWIELNWNWKKKKNWKLREIWGHLCVCGIYCWTINWNIFFLQRRILYLPTATWLYWL